MGVFTSWFTRRHQEAVPGCCEQDRVPLTKRKRSSQAAVSGTRGGGIKVSFVFGLCQVLKALFCLTEKSNFQNDTLVYVFIFCMFRYYGN